MPPTPPWPFRTPVRRAWAPPGPAIPLVAVPLLPADLGRLFPVERWRQLLTDRVAWMVEQEANPTAAAAHLAREMERVGCWQGPSRFRSPQEAAEQLVSQNPEFLRLVQLNQPLRSPGPWQPKALPEARAAIEETTLAEWIELLTPGMSSLQ